uniref:DUF2612 domain-containing protein n=1 Tax=Caenorhabditis tropicalis TaxID=1561998 RepID=A0A1I7U4F2_9PELO
MQLAWIRMPKSVEDRRIGDIAFGFNGDGNDYRTFWEDPIAGAFTFISALTDLFETDIQGVQVSSESKAAVDWIIRRQNSIDTLTYYNNNVREIEAMWPREFRRRCIVGTDTDFTSEDLNAMLLRGDSNRMYLDVQGELNFEIVTRELNATMVTREVPITYSTDSGWNITIGTSWDYRKQDGTMVSVFFDEEGINIYPMFVMVTWPDSQENTYDS